MTDTVKAGQTQKQPGLLHAGFEVGILLKGIHAVLELIGGFLLLLVSPESLGRIVRALTQNELTEDPRDFLANLIVRASESYSISTQHFGAFYLFSHGGIKIVLVFLLWKKKLWSYPLAVASLALFIVFQMVRWTTTHSILLIAFTVVDAIMIWLTLSEYRRLRRERIDYRGIGGRS